MKPNFRFVLVRGALVSSILFVAAARAQFADSAVGVGSVLGHALGPAPAKSLPQDPAWLAAKHTPTGQMFKLPFALPAVRKLAAGWEYSGQVEFGYLGGDADEENARFRMYQDLDEGAYLNHLSLHLQKDAYSVDVAVGAAGREDQYYGLQIGRANSWRLKLFFSEIPHVFTDRYKTLWSGLGTGQHLLLPGLTPGGTTSTLADNTAIAAVAAANPITLGLTRERTGGRLDVDLTPTWKAYAAYAVEERKGSRPLGAVWGNSGGTAPLEIAEPIDYETHDILAGVQHASGLNAFNLRFSASVFRNNLSTLTFQEPHRIAPAQGVTTVPATGAFTEARFDLTPSNNAYNVRAEYTRSLPDFYRSSLTAVISTGEWRQDDTLVPYMITPNVNQANVQLLPGGNWDALSALSRRSTNGLIETRMADLSFTMNPTTALTLRGKGRFYETDNDTDPFLSVNPNAVYLDADAGTAGNQTRGLTLDGVTGVWGRPLNDGSGLSILFGQNSGPAGNIAIKSKPYEARQHRLGATADYRPGKASTFTTAYERETIRRKYRERDETWDDRIKFGYTHRSWGDSTVRASYEYGHRRGTDYVPSHYDEFFSPALIPLPTTPGANVTSWIRMNSGFRSLELADRNQHVVTGRLDTMLRRDLDVGLSGQLRDSDYPNSPYGRTGDTLRSANVDLYYQPSPKQSIYAFYSYQIGRLDQRSIASVNANVVIGQTSALGVITPANAVEIGSAPGGPLFPLNNEWTGRNTDRNHVAGVGLKQDFGKASLNLDYTYTTGVSRIVYQYNVGGALNAANAAFAGNRMPDLATQFNFLDASLRVPLTERLAARLVYRYQKETIRDWHYRNLEATPVVPGNQGLGALPAAVMLDGGPTDYTVNWFGVILQIKL